ncbi:site-2 protease family protein [Metasolibacillus meyeri]|uniref:site-2 protease family protein n=1 Tax=Metasolibacillus meyeri TaxID=1071052 RepID=UPI00187D5D50|nr:site-2 protease family protein [Metasolibacillus meyeri]
MGGGFEQYMIDIYNFYYNTAFMSFSESIWTLLLGLLYLPIAILIHELGHALFGTLVKVKITEVSVGTGQSLFQYGRFRVRRNLLKGYFKYDASNPLTTYQSILLALGGIIANLVTATAVWILGDIAYADWYRPFILVSYSMAVVNLFPFKMKRESELYDSDGLMVFKSIKYAMKR